MTTAALRLPPPPPTLLADASLFLDFDGTLVDLADDPWGVIVSDDLRGLLARLHRGLGGRLAMVSGRQVEILHGRFGFAGLTVVGSHGLERALPGGTLEQAAAPPALPAIIAELQAFAEPRDGVLVEAKPLGAALHYRMAPAQEAACLAEIERLADAHGAAVQHGKMMAELRPHGADKGSALTALAALAPFDAGRPVFIGDDLTDEHGFRAAAALGGHGILVGDRTGSAASFALPDVAAVHGWLAAGLATLEARA